MQKPSNSFVGYLGVIMLLFALVFAHVAKKNIWKKSTSMNSKHTMAE